MMMNQRRSITNEHGQQFARSRMSMQQMSRWAGWSSDKFTPCLFNQAGTGVGVIMTLTHEPCAFKSLFLITHIRAWYFSRADPGIIGWFCVLNPFALWPSTMDMCFVVRHAKPWRDHGRGGGIWRLRNGYLTTLASTIAVQFYVMPRNTHAETNTCYVYAMLGFVGINDPHLIHWQWSHASFISIILS